MSHLSSTPQRTPRTRSYSVASMVHSESLRMSSLVSLAVQGILCAIKNSGGAINCRLQRGPQTVYSCLCELFAAGKACLPRPNLTRWTAISRLSSSQRSSTAMAINWPILERPKMIKIHTTSPPVAITVSFATRISTTILK